MKKSVKRIVLLTIAFIILLSVYLVFDYFNVPYKIGISVNNINIDLFSIVFGNGIIIFIAVITYILIDKQNIKKDKNIKYVIFQFISETYNTYSNYIYTIEKRIDSENPDNEKLFTSGILQIFSETSLENDAKIYDGMINGILDYKIYESYSYIKNKFETILKFLDYEEYKYCKIFIKEIKEKLEQEKQNIEDYKNQLK